MRWRLCGPQQRPLVLRLMKVVTESATREAARAALRPAIAELEKKAPKVARLLEDHGEEILGVYALPEAHRKRMRTTNMLERQNQELKRRTRVIRVFPHEQSCLRLIDGAADGNQSGVDGEDLPAHGGTRGRNRGPGRGRLRGAGLLRATPSASPPLSTNKNKNQLP